MTGDNIRTVWTDDELDAALARLHPAAPAEPAVLTAAWNQVAREMSTVNGIVPDEPSTQDTVGVVRSGRVWLKWTAVAAAAAAVVAVAGGVTAHLTGSANPPTDATRVVTAAMVLQDAGAAAIKTHDQPVPPGEFRYLETHGWGAVTGVADKGVVTFLDEQIVRTWIPADRTQVWTTTTTYTGKVQWISGTAAEAAAIGMKVPTGTTTIQAPCGDFYPSGGAKQGSCADPAVSRGSWQHPTAAWLAGLPRDPGQLLARLRHDAPRNGRGDAELLTYATDALGTGLLPGDVRGALYRALALLPDVSITAHTATLDGRTGVAFAVSDNHSGHDRQEFVVDPATGDFIGERDIALAASSGMPAGTVMGSSSTTTAVVAKVGDTR
jgi:hypothetical protein